MTTTLRTVAMFLLLIYENISHITYSYIRDTSVSNWPATFYDLFVRAKKNRKLKTDFMQPPFWPFNFNSQFLKTLCISKFITSGRYRVVGVLTRYGLNGPGIEFRWWRDFPPPSRPAVGPTQPPVQFVLGHFRGKAAGATDSHLQPRLKKEQNYTSTPPLGLRGLF
jgi:hypothetical protein